MQVYRNMDCKETQGRVVILSVDKEGVQMIVEHIGKSLLNYRFPEEEGFLYGFNLYALLNGKDVMLIDSAFRTQSKQVLSNLKSRGLRLTHVLVTHFHADHVAGLAAIDPGVTVLGSPEYRKTLTKDISQRIAAVAFSDGFSFGDFTLSFIPAPGHSACSILVDINGKYLHAGDNLMSRYDGKAILPWVEHHQLENHISSLEMLREMKRDRVLLAHGPEICGKETITQAIDDRLSYLRAVLDSEGNTSFEEAVSGSSCSFVGEEFFRQLTTHLS